MERKTGYALSGVLLLLSLSGAVAQGQDSPPPGGLPDQPSAPQNPGQRAAKGRNSISTPSAKGGYNGTNFSSYSGADITGLPLPPELGKKTMSVMALREMYTLHLTAKDLSAALPLLKDLHKAERTLQSRSEQVLEEEKRALLTAAPEDTPPPGSEEKLRDLMNDYNVKQNEVWSSIARAIGKEKSAGLRRLIEGGRLPYSSFDFGGSSGKTGTNGRGRGSGVGGGSSSLPGPRPGSPPKPLDTPNQPLDPAEGQDVDPAAPSAPLAVGVSGGITLPGDDTAPVAPGLAPPAGVLAPADPPNPGQAPPASAIAPATPTNPGQAPPRAAVTPAAPSPDPRVAPSGTGFFSAPVAPARAGQNQNRNSGQGGNTAFTFFYAPPRLTLAELIDLMEQKLNAMKH